MWGWRGYALGRLLRYFDDNEGRTVQKPGAAAPLLRAHVHTTTISANTSVRAVFAIDADATVTSGDVDVLSASVTCDRLGEQGHVVREPRSRGTNELKK